MVDRDRPIPGRFREIAMTLDAMRREDERLASLDRYDILDTPREESFERITRLVRRVFDVPIATVTLIDGHRQWFKSQHGLGMPETPRGPALCNVAIRQADPMVIPDTLLDARFFDNPFVVGEPRLRFYAGAPLRTPEGHNIGMLCAMDTRPRALDSGQIEVLSDLARIVMSELELRLLAMTDALTGALSRRAFHDDGARAVSLARRHGHDLGCVVLDLDHFKAVNDTHGHAGGDQVLARSLATCRAALRGSDLVGRIGGEEFAILLPHSGAAATLATAEKLRLAIAAQRIAGGAAGAAIAVTASFGLATMEAGVADLDALLARADQALYAAKAGGRDRCVVWAPGGAAPLRARARVLKAGLISIENGAAIDCTVRSLSEAGAGLDVIDAADVPDAFKLQIEADGLSRLCRVVAKRDRHVEVGFDQAA